MSSAEISMESLCVDPGTKMLTSAEAHELALTAFRTGNRGHLTLIMTLKVIEEHRLYLELSYPSVAAYAEAHFDFGRSEAYEALRVAHALDGLAKLRAAYEHGEIGWSKLKAITRIANSATEEEWLKFAKKHTVEQVQAEVRDALEKGRDTPRKNGHSLPNLVERLVLKFTRSEMEKIRQGLGPVRAELAEKLGRDDVSTRDALLYICERLQAGGTASLEEASGIEPSGYAVVYHVCPHCRESSMQTPSGPVEVGREEVERVEGDAHIEHIDGPTPPALRRKVLLREGQTCANPHCTHRARHAHHIIWRKDGGKSVLWNEVAVCPTCHALIHAGLLEVSGRPGESLQWKTIADTLSRSIRAGAEAVRELPVPVGVSAYADSSRSADEASGSAALSARADSGLSAHEDSRQSSDADSDPVSLLGPQRFKDLVGGLRQLGFDKETAEKDLRQALQELPREEWTVSELLQTAVEYRRERDRLWRENENAPLGSADAPESEARCAHARHRIAPHPREPRPDYRFISVRP